MRNERGVTKGATVREWRAVASFDIDGTLVPGTTSGAFLAERLGHLDALKDAERRYEAGELDNHEVCRVDGLGWTGRTPAEVRAWLADLPLVGGVGETLAWCRANAVLPVLASLAWAPVGEYLADRFGFADWCGPTLVVAEGRYTGAVDASLDEFGKRDFVLAACAEAGVPAQRCVAVGDSRSDLPLFAAVGQAVAFNGTPAARAASDHQVDGSDLTGVIAPLADWLVGTGHDG